MEVLTSYDGGHSWTAQTLDLSLDDFSAISCASPTVCFATGISGAYTAPVGVVIGSTDGGETWSEEPVPGGATFYSNVSCASSTQCVAVGSVQAAVGPLGSGVVVSTNDGGATWTLASTPNNSFNDGPVACYGEFCALATDVTVQSEGVTVSDDGGLTWGEPASLLPTNDLQGLSCSSATTCIGVGGGYGQQGIAAGTEDAGSSWEELATFADTEPVGVSCPTESDCVALQAGSALTTTDAGRYWAATPLPANSAGWVFDSISCSSASNCVAVSTSCFAPGDCGANGTFAPMILVSSDRGSTWQEPEVPAEMNSFSSVSCPTTTECVAVGEGVNDGGLFGAAVITTDGGQSWSEQTLPVAASDPVGVSCADENDCVVVTGNGSVVSTTDAGQEWTEGTTPNAITQLAAVDCPTAEVCYAVGEGYVIATTDGGSSWNLQATPPGTDWLDGISCSTTTICVAVANGTNPIIGTLNGLTWVVQSVPSTVDGLGASGVSCTPSSSCAAIGGYANGDVGNGPIGGWTGVILTLGCPVDQLVFSMQPGGGSAGQPWTVQPVVTIEDAEGNTVTSDESPITLSITPGSGPPEASLSGCFATTTSGVAVFGGCQIDEGLNGYQLTATDSTDWLSVTSDPFDVLPSPPKTLAISTPPTEEIAGQIWSTQPVVTIEDAEGKPVPSDTSPITLSIAPGTGAPGATLSGCEATTTFGVARFSGCHLDAAGTGFQLIASDNADSLSVTSGAFDVAMAASVTTLTVPSLSETVGEPVTVEVQVASAAPNTPALAPTGLVDVSDGIDTCQGPLTDEGNVALGSCTVTPQAAGFYAFDAIYLGDSNFNPSGVQNTPIVVEQAVSETSIDLSSEMVRYGDEGFDEISVTVKTSPAQIPPSGTITIRRSQRILCASELHDATATCRLPPTALNAGVADIVAAYSGSASLAPSTSPARALTVLKASSKTILHLSTPRAHYGDENVEEISVAVVPEFAGSKPSGTVVVGTSATRGCVIDLRAGTGSCRLGSKRLPAGRYQVVADYAGSIDFRASSSRNGTLTIVAP